MIPYSRQTVTQSDIDEVVSVLKSDFLTQGPAVPKFERKVAEYCGAKYSVASCNATSALHTACLSLGIKHNDEVWVAAISFVASANCARYCGADIGFVDINPNTGLICLDDLKKQLDQAKSKNKVPKALVVVHLAGHSAPMKEVSDLCRDSGVLIIEDASHALGGKYLDQPVGSCIYSDVCVFSFHPVKSVTAGEGGMLLTNRLDVYQKARMYISHGIEREEEKWQESNKNGWYYEQQALGFNYRLSDIHAALGASQFNRLDQQIASRKEFAKEYDAYFLTHSGQPLSRSDLCESAFHLYVVRFENKQKRSHLFKQLRKAGFGVNLHYIPIPAHPYYQAIGYDLSHYPGAREYADTAISLPLFQYMDKQIIHDVTSLITLVLDK